MSQLRVFTFDKNGDVKNHVRITNAKLCIDFVWRTLEKKYLPSLPHHDWMLTDKDEYVSRFDAYGFTKKEYQRELQDIWMLSLQGSPATDDERMVLESTFSRVLIKKEDFARVADVLDAFCSKYGGNLGLQADVLRKSLDDDNVVAIGWSDLERKGWDEAGENDEPYNLNTGNIHRFLDMGDYDDK